MSKQKIYHLLVLLITLLITLFLGSRIARLNFDYEFEAFFPNEDKELELYNAFRTDFEHDNEFVLLGIENKDGIFRKDFLIKIDSLCAMLQNLEDVKQVSSPTNLKHTSLGGLVPVQTRVLHIEDTSRYYQDSINIYRSPYLVGSFFPENAKSLSIVIKTRDGLSKKRSDVLADTMRATVSKFNFDDVHIAGRIFASQVYLKNVQREFLLFLSISFVLVIIFLWLSFKSLYGVIVPVAVVLVSIAWTLGVMQLMGKAVDVMAIMLPTMIFVAGMSDVVHFFSKYFEELSKGTEKVRIYRLVLKEVGFPTFLTLATTVVGFLSLLFSSIRPVREFGIYTSVGVIIAFILTYTLLPALLHFFDPPRMIKLHSANNRTDNAMRSALFWIFRHQRTILLVTALVLVLSLIGITKIKVNHFLLDDLDKKVRIKQDFNFFDKYYSGARPLEIQVDISSGNKHIWDYEVLQQLDKIDQFIKKEYAAGFLVSPSSFVKELYRNSSGDTSNIFPGKEEAEPYITLLYSNRKNKDLKKILSADGKKARISAKINDMGSEKVELHNLALRNYLKTQPGTGNMELNLTGAAHLIDLNNNYMVSNMTQGFVFSIVVIGLLTYFLHRSWRMVLVFMLPNVIPLLIIAGIMGYAGIELKAATSLVFSIAFGIATDDTIHFISRLKIELAYGKSLLYAFKRTYFETGRPIVLTTFILTGGFMSLMLSNFQSTFYFGFLICITIVIAVIADLFLLPVLLFLVYRKK